MIPLSQLYSIAILLAPVFTCFAIILILSLDSWKLTAEHRNVTSKVIMYFACSFINWGSLIFYFFQPIIFVYINWFVFLSFMLVQVYFYAFIFKITRIDSNETFSKKHYILPVLLSLILLFISLITPLDYQLQIIKDQGHCNNEAYRLFFTISNSKIPVRFGFSAVYITLSYLRISRYRKFIVNYSANEDKTQLKWILYYLFLAIGVTPLPIIAFFYGDRSFVISSLIMGVYNFIFIFQYVYLTYYVLKEKYTVVSDKEEVTKHTEINDDKELKKNVLSREYFETFIQSQKPYLNPELKITDLVNDLLVNRTYISAFINTEYQVNFSMYINQCRFNEYLRLTETESNKGKTKKELSEMAGFSSYQSFQRYNLLASKKSDV